MKSVGNKPAFPSVDNTEVDLGMTYRQVIIKEIAPAFVTVYGAQNLKLCAVKTIEYADLLLAELDAEQETANDRD